MYQKKHTLVVLRILNLKIYMTDSTYMMTCVYVSKLLASLEKLSKSFCAIISNVAKITYDLSL